MKTILITGATGAIGSQLAPRLVAAGWNVVCVVRSKAGQGPAERLADEFGPLAGRMTAVGGDIRSPMLGLAPAEIASLRGGVTTALHCAASVTFDAAAGPETWETNVGGTRNFLDLAEELGLTQAHLVSTAYVAGDSAEFSEDDLHRGQPRNPYEASKREAEAIFRARFPGAFSIYRPSIVVGDSLSGATRAFDGFYGVAKACHRLARFLMARSETPAGGHVHLPLTIRSSAGATLNMVPVDWVTEAIVRLLETPPTGRCYHLTHPQPAVLASVMETGQRRLGIQGLRLEPEPQDDLPRAIQGLQRRLDSHLERYSFYLNGEPVFGHRAVKDALGQAYAPPPPIDAEMLRLLLDYAIAVDWEPRPTPLPALAGLAPAARPDLEMAEG